jgi:hypothetical protein
MGLNLSGLVAVDFGDLVDTVSEFVAVPINEKSSLFKNILINSSRPTNHEKRVNKV